MKRSLPQSVELDADEARRINRARVAVTLHLTPRDVDRLPLTDVWDVLGILQVDAEDAKKA